MPKRKRPSKRSAKPAAPAPNRKPGRPPDTGFKPTDRDRKDVEIAAALGIPHDDLVQLIVNPTSGRPISPTTMRKVFPEELRTGMVKAKMRGGANLLKLTETSAAAAIFFAKVRLGMKETLKVEHSGKVQTTAHLTDEQMDRRIQQLLAKGEKGNGRQPRRDRSKP